jgi:hypothetical protein
MSIFKRVEQQINSMPDGKVITYSSLYGIKAEEMAAAAQAFGRLVKSGALKRLSRGTFYKPKKSRFGELALVEEEQLRPALEKGYLTGTEAFRRLGITTQVPMEVVVAAPNRAYTTRIGKVKVKYVRSTVNSSSADTELLLILDALKQSKKIPGASPEKVVSALSKRIQGLDSKRANELVELALLYPPRVRAVLGAIMESVGKKRPTARLKTSLNPLSKYKISLGSTLPNARQWNIQ